MTLVWVRGDIREPPLTNSKQSVVQYTKDPHVQASCMLPFSYPWSCKLNDRTHCANTSCVVASSAYTEYQPWGSCGGSPVQGSPGAQITRSAAVSRGRP